MKWVEVGISTVEPQVFLGHVLYGRLLRLPPPSDFRPNLPTQGRGLR
jgi:hypothetical protein